MNSNIIIIFIPFILGFISSLFVNKNNIPSVESPINPPKWLFGVVWPILYLLLGYSSYIIYNSKALNKNKILPSKPIFTQGEKICGDFKKGA